VRVKPASQPTMYKNDSYKAKKSSVNLPAVLLNRFVDFSNSLGVMRHVHNKLFSLERAGIQVSDQWIFNRGRKYKQKLIQICCNMTQTSNKEHIS
jgi:hypothetical protein